MLGDIVLLADDDAANRDMAAVCTSEQRPNANKTVPPISSYT